MPIDAAKASEQWLRYMYCRDRGHLPFLEKAEKCELFFAGEQWTQTDLAALRAAKRPALTINKIISTMSTVFGEQIYNRSETLYRPQNGSSAETSEVLTKVFKHVAQQNQLNWVRSDLFADGGIRSRGFVDIRLDFHDSMRGEIAITNLNSKNVVIDPDAEEYDPDFWNDVFITKWMTPQDINILYSDDDAKILQDRDGSAYPYGYDSIERVRDRFGGNQLLAAYYGILDPHHVRRNVRVIDRQYRRLDKQLHFVDVKTGDMRAVPTDWDRNRIAMLLEKAGGQLSTTKKLVKRIRWTVTADTVVLHDDWSPYKHFTVVPYFPHFRYGRTVGLVENLIGSQELLNKTSSQELHVINTTANSGWKLKVGSLQNMSVEELEQKGAQTGLVMELTDVKDAEKILPNSTPTGLDRISYKAEEHIKSISGVSDSMQGFDREDVAAKAIQTKRQVGSQNMTKIMDNLERTDYIIARNVLDLIQEYYTEERIISITHADPTRQAETITINQVSPEGEITNDLMLGEYGIVISSQPARDSLEDSQFDQVMTMRERGINIPDSIIIESSRLQRKSEIIKQMSSDSESPEAQQRQALQMRLLEAQVAKEEAEATDKKAQAEDRLAAAKLKNVQAENEMSGVEQQAAAEKMRIDQESEAQRMQLTREAHDADLNYQREKLQLEKERMQMELDNKRQMAELELATAKQKAAQEERIRERESVQKMAVDAKQSNISSLNDED
jgi:hypothetical protein